jgi:hypothetical protein
MMMPDGSGVVCSHLEEEVMTTCMNGHDTDIFQSGPFAGAAAELSCSLHVPCWRWSLLVVMVVVTLLIYGV